ncbi:MAG TPA: hypothetical protein VM939_00035 [Gemmatimonadaceae bacterium]|nr:hypothetical protein [Gemmatimonadaceae bacterium]
MRFALLAIGLLLSGCNGPVHQTRTENEIEAVIDMANKAMNVTQKILDGASTPDVQAALGDLTAAATAVLDATKGHRTTATSDAVGSLDASASAAVGACAHSSVIELLDVERMSERLLQHWAMEVNRCLTLADTNLRTASSKEAIEEIGFAVNMVYPAALVAHAKAGFETRPLVADYRAASETIIERLGARCSSAQAPLSSCGVALAVQPRLGEWARTIATTARQRN